MWRSWGTPQNFLLAFIDEHWKTWKIRILKKLLKISFYTYIPRGTIIRGTVPEITELDIFFFDILGQFLPLYPPSPNNPENQNFEKMKIASGDVIIVNLCNKEHDHMMYTYSDMECGRQFFVILGHFLLLYPTIDPKN